MADGKKVVDVKGSVVAEWLFAAYLHQEVYYNIFTHENNTKRTSDSDSLVVDVNKTYEGFVLPGGSRCFAPDTKVRMFDGKLKNIQDIKIGDKVMHFSGIGFNVVTGFHSGIDQMFKVKQARGIDYVVNSNHILSLKQTRPFEKKIPIPGYKSDEKRFHSRLPYDKDVIHNFEISEFTKKSKRYKRNFTGFKNTNIELPYQKINIDPYYLGLWIGDGTSVSPHEITNIDPEIISYLQDKAIELKTTLKKIDSVSYRLMAAEEGSKVTLNNAVSDMNREFKKYGLINNKHIPEDFIYNSKEVRLRLLAGLIDSDGCDTGRNTISITQTKRIILEGVLEICRLSGFFTNGINKCKTSMKRSDGSMYVGEAYSIEINHSDFEELNTYLKIPRKRIIKDCDRNYFSTSIDIEPLGLGEYFGFSLHDSPYFLLEDGTVVHNSSKTWSIIQFLISYCARNNNKRKNILIARQQYSDLKDSVMKDFFDILNLYGLYRDDNHLKSNPQKYILYGNTISFSGLDTSGAHGKKYDVVWINEAFEAEKDAFDQLEMRLTEFFILDYNPCFTEHWILNSVITRPNVWLAPISTQLNNPWLEQRIRNKILSYDPSNPENVINGTADDFMWAVYGQGIGAQPQGIIFPYVDWINEFPEGLDYWYGEDFGFTSDPSAIVKIAQNGLDVYLEKKLYTPTETSATLNEAMFAIGIEKYIPITADSSDKYVSAKYGAQEMVKDLQKYGWNIQKASKKGNKVDWIRKLKEYHLHIVISPEFKKEQQSYRWRTVNGIQINEPIDKFDHLWTATFYGLILKQIRRSRFRNSD